MPSLLERTGIITDEVSPDFVDALGWVAAEGLQHVEVRTVDGKNVAAISDAEAREVIGAIEGHGLFVSAIASPLFKCALDPSRPVASGDRFGQQEESVEDHFVKLERVIAIARILKTRRIRIFSFWREIAPAKYQTDVIRLLQRAADVAARSNILLLVENEPSCNGGFADEVGQIVRRVDHPNLKALWDPGNEAYGGREAFPAGYQHLKDVLAHVHLKDAYIGANGVPRCVPLGSGNVPFIAHFQALASDGYPGLFTLETHFTPAGGSAKTGSKMTLEALRVLAKACEAPANPRG